MLVIMKRDRLMLVRGWDDYLTLIQDLDAELELVEKH